MNIRRKPTTRKPSVRAKPKSDSDVFEIDSDPMFERALALAAAVRKQVGNEIVRGAKKGSSAPKPILEWANPICQIKITLEGFSPPIWRRVLVHGETSLALLHDIIQAAMDWDDSHLHAFDVQGVSFGSHGRGRDPLDMRDESEITLFKALRSVGAKIKYEYDFGDSWRHVILLEKRLPVDASLEYPVCIGGRRAAPIEDSGGAWGYANLVDALDDPDHPDHAQMKEWHEGLIDPAKFDPDEVNARLSRVRKNSDQE